MENKLVRKAQKIFHNHRKSIYQSIRAKKSQQSILFIVGCQRSGTTMMLHIFEGDLNTKCFAERSALTSKDTVRGIRLNPPELIKRQLSRVRAPLIVIKPLVESQNTPALLDYFENSQAVWMFRNYKDVAQSNLKHFGIKTGINDLRAIMNNDTKNWRAEKVSQHVRETISKYFSEDMNPYDAAVLFWFARNRLYFELNLQADPRVILCRYEEFVLAPEKHLRAIYQRVGQVYPEASTTSIVHSNSRQKGKDIELSPEIEQLAQDMQKKLEVAYRSQTFQVQ